LFEVQAIIRLANYGLCQFTGDEDSLKIVEELSTHSYALEAAARLVGQIAEQLELIGHSVPGSTAETLLLEAIKQLETDNTGSREHHGAKVIRAAIKELEATRDPTYRPVLDKLDSAYAELDVLDNGRSDPRSVHASADNVASVTTAQKPSSAASISG
jgi:hypothetical protein